MDAKGWMYLTYLALSVGLTVSVARMLSHAGLVFLADALGDERLARSVNQLLVVGFYLISLGYAAFAMRTDGAIVTITDVLERLSAKIGLVMLVLGLVHVFNVFALNRYRRSRRRHEGGPPPPPGSPAYPPPGEPAWQGPGGGRA
jgi:hypothetical protein